MPLPIAELASNVLLYGAQVSGSVVRLFVIHAHNIGCSSAPTTASLYRTRAPIECAVVAGSDHCKEAAEALGAPDAAPTQLIELVGRRATLGRDVKGLLVQSGHDTCGLTHGIYVHKDMVIREETGFSRADLCKRMARDILWTGHSCGADIHCLAASKGLLKGHRHKEAGVAAASFMAGAATTCQGGCSGPAAVVLNGMGKSKAEEMTREIMSETPTTPQYLGEVMLPAGTVLACSGGQWCVFGSAEDAQRRAMAVQTEIALLTSVLLSWCSVCAPGCGGRADGTACIGTSSCGSEMKLHLHDGVRFEVRAAPGGWAAAAEVSHLQRTGESSVRVMGGGFAEMDQLRRRTDEKHEEARRMTAHMIEEVSIVVETEQAKQRKTELELEAMKHEAEEASDVASQASESAQSAKAEADSAREYARKAQEEATYQRQQRVKAEEDLELKRIVEQMVEKESS